MSFEYTNLEPVDQLDGAHEYATVNVTGCGFDSHSTK